MTIISPDIPKKSAARVSAATIHDPLDRKIIEESAKRGDVPSPIWTVLHAIATNEGSVSRTQRRLLLCRLLCRARALERVGVLERVDRNLVRLRPAPATAAAPNAPGVSALNEPPALAPTAATWGMIPSGGARTAIFRA